mmetsp:Transcript_27406/g.56104  ORF Transcript_27406/g.56104 Transcript_27406/m.56104 type:complete len:286 (+) Transcript_27406:137-994(+)
MAGTNSQPRSILYESLVRKRSQRETVRWLCVSMTSFVVSNCHGFSPPNSLQGRCHIGIACEKSPGSAFSSESCAEEKLCEQPLASVCAPAIDGTVSENVDTRDVASINFGFSQKIGTLAHLRVTPTCFGLIPLRGGSRKNNIHLRKAKHKFAMQLAYSDQERAVARSKERIRKQSEREQDELVDALKATGIFQGGVRKRKGKARRSQDSPQKKQKGRPKTVPSGPVDPFLGFPNEAKAERKAKRQKVSRRDKNDLLRRRKMERRFAAAGQTLEEAQAKLERGRLF